MIDRIITLSIQNRFWVCLLTLLLVVYGVMNLRDLSIDAVPDVTNRQVQINAVAPALSPEEVERRITFPLEVALGGIPRIQNLRSISQFGLSQVTVIFDDDIDIYFARQLVTERLQDVKDQLPSDTQTSMAPVSTGLGEILYLQLKNPNLSLMERRRLMDWVVRPQLRNIPGLAEANVWGGEVRQLQIRADPLKLQSFGLDLHSLWAAVQGNNANGGGSFIERGSEQQLVTSLGMLNHADDLKSIVLKQENHVPVLLGQVAEVGEGAMPRQGAITQDGKGEEVYAICLLLLGENGHQTVQRIKAKIPQIEAALPPGTKLEPFLDRSRLIGKTLKTASKNLLEGGFLVIALLFLFLLQLRAGFIVSSAIPLSMLVAIIGMRQFDISANLMSLGAIDFGLIVDGAVIIVENCVRRLGEEVEHRGELTEEYRLQVIASASAEVRSATQLGEIIILSTYIPILSLQGIEGKMFRPMGWTVILALTGAMILSFTLIPALCAYFLKAEIEQPHPILSKLESLYSRLLEGCLRRSWILIGASIVALLFSGSLVFGLGTEFIPELDEGSIAMQVTYPTGISLRESVLQSGKIESTVHSSLGKQVVKVVTRIGRPEIATDPMLANQTDVIIELAPEVDRLEAIARLEKSLKELPGIEYSFTQPIKMRMMELIEGNGVRADLGIKLYGAEHAQLAIEAQKIAAVVKQIRGAADVQVETTEGLPQLQIQIERAQLAPYGLNVSDINQTLEAALGGRAVSTINDGNERYDITVALAENYRQDPEALASLKVLTPDRQLIPLSQLATIRSVEGPVQISREKGKRRIVIQSNVRGRDLGSFVEEVQRRVAKIKLPTGYYPEYGGTYEKLQSGRARLTLVVPLTFVAVYGLLYLNFSSVRLASLVSTGIPFAVSGGIVALWARSMPLSISAAIGFVALAGVAVLNGVVMVTFIGSLREQGIELREAIMQGARQRLRPVLMTAAVASFGFFPMALSHGAGAEVQKPLATVVIGGLISSTALTLVLLPLLYWLLHRKKA